MLYCTFKFCAIYFFAYNTTGPSRYMWDSVESPGKGKKKKPQKTKKNPQNKQKKKKKVVLA